MKVPTKPFLKVLSRVAVSDSKRGTLPILCCCKLESDGKVLTVSATDLESWAVASCECDGEMESVCVNTSTLMAIVSWLVDDVELSVKAGKLRISGNSRAGIPYLSADEFPPLPSKDLKPQGISCADLADGIEAVKWAVDASPNLGRPMVNNIRVLSTGKSLICTATNGRKLAQLERLIISASAQFMFVPDEAVAICKALREPGAIISLSDNYMMVKSKFWTFIVRLSEFSYPSTDTVLKRKREPVGKFELAPLAEALERVNFLTTNKSLSGKTQITPCKDGLRLEFSDGQSELDMVIAGKFEGQPFLVQAQSTAEMLRKFPQSEAQISLANDSLLIAEAGDYVSAVSLMK